MILTQLWLNCISNVRETIWFLDLKIRFLQRLTQSERHDCLTPGQASEKTWLTSTKSNGIFNDQSIIRPLSLMSQSSFFRLPQWSHGAMVRAANPCRATPYKCRRCVDLGEMRPWNEKTHRDTAWFYPIIQWILGGTFWPIFTSGFDGM